MTDLLDPAGLMSAIHDGTFGAGPGATVFRMELLPAYSVVSDGGDFARWRDGAPEPDRDRKEPTIRRLAERAAAGISSRRVRVLSAEVTEYERYACDFGYGPNAAAGEDIRVLRHGEHQVPELLGFDYWVLNSRTVLRMHYDTEGAFVGAENAPDLLPDVLREHDLVWSRAEAFAPWWSRHPELRQRLVV
ncbi:DUF6879 family protein [Pseudonocardia sp. HH130630-07]|uniref:DUF6879 family protein n=1 Tax=Pseudonocardia sp. HH130630-07 TaxID=1690815 RepID=UPI000814E171|nr:DUF6879 family protein [Pseudonocardia sp. HH130630-07]ANY06587.1 hypothetical protein AFB00_10105 [Pseudonocardia sp. HH130630-07]